MKGDRSGRDASVFRILWHLSSVIGRKADIHIILNNLIKKYPVSCLSHSCPASSEAGFIFVYKEDRVCLTNVFREKV